LLCILEDDLGIGVSEGIKNTSGRAERVRLSKGRVISFKRRRRWCCARDVSVYNFGGKKGDVESEVIERKGEVLVRVASTVVENPGRERE
jgi:hypothetical protein